MMDRLPLEFIQRLVLKHGRIEALMSGHLFVDILDTVPKNWYTETELRKGSENWSMMIDGFKLTFEFESEYPKIEDALEVIWTKVFKDGPFTLYNQPD